eukprot:6178513-Pleurochrysis_carterae.AAC.3
MGCIQTYIIDFWHTMLTKRLLKDTVGSVATMRDACTGILHKLQVTEARNAGAREWTHPRRDSHAEYFPSGLPDAKRLPSSLASLLEPESAPLCARLQRRLAMVAHHACWLAMLAQATATSLS